MNARIHRTLQRTAIMLVALLAAWTTASAQPMTIKQSVPKHGQTIVNDPPLTQISFEFEQSNSQADSERVSVVRDSGLKATLTLKAGTAEPTVVATIDAADTQAITTGAAYPKLSWVYINFPAQSAAGTYTLSIPAGMFHNDDTGTDNTAIDLTFDMQAAGFEVMTPSDAEITPSMAKTIVIEYPGAKQVLLSADASADLNQYLRGATTLCTKYSVRVEGTNKVVLEAADPAALKPQDLATSMYHMTLSVPAGAWTVDGVANKAIEKTYYLRSITAGSFNISPALNTASQISANELASIELTTDGIDIEAVTASNIALQWLKPDGKWKNPVFYYQPTLVDKHTIRLNPVNLSSYPVNLSALETGKYRMQIAAKAITVDGVKNAAIVLGEWNVVKSDEILPASVTPEQDTEYPRGRDFDSFTITYGEPMVKGEGTLSVFIGNSTTPHYTLDAADAVLSEDKKSLIVTLPADKAIAPGAVNQTIKVQAPKGFVKAEATEPTQRPAAKIDMWYTLHFATPKRGVWMGNTVISPNPAGYKPSSIKYTFNYPGAQSIVLNEAAMNLIVMCDGQNNKGVDIKPATKPCAVTLVDNSTVQVYYSAGIYTMADKPYYIQIPENAWSIFTDEGEYYNAPQDVIINYPITTNAVSITASTGVQPKEGAIDILNVATDLATITLTTNKNAVGPAEAASTVGLYRMGAKGMPTGEPVLTYSIAGDAKKLVLTKTGGNFEDVTLGNYVLFLDKTQWKWGATAGNPDTENSYDLYYYWRVTEQKLIELTPEYPDGTAFPALSQITVTANDCYGIARNFNIQIVAEGDNVSSDDDMQMTTNPTIKGNRCTLKLFPVYKTAGEYKLTLPQGFFNCDGYPSKELVLTYKVLDAPTWSVAPGSNINSPTVVKQLGQLELAYAEGVNPAQSKNEPLLYTTKMVQSEEILTPVNTKVRTSYSGNKIIMTFDPIITANDVYALRLPENTYTINGVPNATTVNYYKVYDPTGCTFSPKTDTQLEEISGLEMTFANSTTVTVNEGKSALVADAEGNALEGYKVTAVIADAPAPLAEGDNTGEGEGEGEGGEDPTPDPTPVVKANRVLVSVEPAIVDRGTYTIVFPAGMFTCDEEASSDYRVSYRVLNYAQAVASPAQSEPLYALDKITINFPQSQNVTVAEGAVVNVSLPADAANEVTLSAEANNGIITISPAYRAAQNETVTVTIPAGTFVCNGVLNKEITLSYNVLYDAAIKATVTPESGSTVEKLEAIEVVFADAQTAALAEEKSVVTPEGITLTAAKKGDNGFTFTLEPAQEKNAELTFKFPDGLFVIDGSRANEEFEASYTVYNPAQAVFTPADGETLKQLSTVTVEFPNATTVAIENTPNSVTVNGEIMENLTVAVEGNKFVINIAPAIIDGGEYTVAIPEGYLKFDGKAVAPAYSVKYTVLNRTQAIVTPTEDEVLYSLGEIKINFPQAQAVTVGQAEVTIATEIEGERTTVLYTEGTNTGVVAISPAITTLTEGEVTVTIPAGAFLCNGEPSEAMTLTYKLAHDPVLDYTLSIADGETVKNLTSLDVTFAAATSGIVMPNKNVTIEPAGSTVINVAKKGENSFTITFAPIIEEEGDYKLTIPAGMFNLDNGHMSDEITATYTVDPKVGVASIFADYDGLYDVYTVDGICILHDADVEAVRQLRSGLYIINGRRVMLNN